MAYEPILGANPPLPEGGLRDGAGRPTLLTRTGELPLRIHRGFITNIAILYRINPNLSMPSPLAGEGAASRRESLHEAPDRAGDTFA